MKCSSVFILGALVGVSIAAPIPATHEGAKIARRQNPLTEIVGLASGVLPVDMKNSGIDKLVGTLNDDVVTGKNQGNHPGKQGLESAGNL